MYIEQNLAAIDERIQNALLTAEKDIDDITIIGVTKTVDLPRIKEALSCGLSHIGENRVQELLEKYDELSDVTWHFIGSLQRNKVKYIIDKVSMIHSLDSLALAREINKEAQKKNLIMPVLIQINIANETTKSGIPCEEAIPFIETVFNLNNIKVMGLMTIPPLEEEPGQSRLYFRAMKQLYDELRSNNYPHTDIKYLSMGMTNDFETAIEEGSNMIRIGTGIFGARTGGLKNGRKIYEQVT